MECALLDGEQKSETTELLKEKEILDHLNRKIAELERNVIGEKAKVIKLSQLAACSVPINLQNAFTQLTYWWKLFYEVDALSKFIWYMWKEK